MYIQFKTSTELSVSRPEEKKRCLYSYIFYFEHEVIKFDCLEYHQNNFTFVKVVYSIQGLRSV